MKTGKPYRERCIIVVVDRGSSSTVILLYRNIMNIISLSAYVLVGKTRGTACGVRRRWRRCRICVSLCRPAGRSCPLSVAGGAVCRGSLTGETAMEVRARPREGETRTRSEPTWVHTPPVHGRWSVATTAARRGGCRTPHVDDVSRPSAESLKNAP